MAHCDTAFCKGRRWQPLVGSWVPPTWGRALGFVPDPMPLGGVCSRLVRVEGVPSLVTDAGPDLVSAYLCPEGFEHGTPREGTWGSNFVLLRFRTPDHALRVVQTVSGGCMPWWVGAWWVNGRCMVGGNMVLDMVEG